MTATELEIAICTFGDEGIARFASGNPPQLDGIRYTVHVQLPDSDAEPVVPSSIAGRDDISIITHRTRGIAVNRNHALDACSAPLAIITDDDVSFYPDALRGVIDDFRNRPDSDIIAYKVFCPATPKDYPEKEFTIRGGKIPKFYFFAASELALRPDRVRRRIRFNEYFGFGTLFQGGEDDIFLVDAVKSGLRWTFVPRIIALHPTVSSGRRPDPEYALVRTKAAVALRQNPLSWPLRMCVRAIRDIRPSYCRGYTSISRYIREWMKGIRLARKHRVFHQ